MSTPARLRRTVAVATSDGAELHATVEGRDDAPVTVVLAHGWTLAQAAWDDVAHLLAPRVAGGELRLVRYDQRGHGRSTWGDAEISVDLLGQDLAALLDRLVPSGPVVLGGHSMGGTTVMCLGAARPELFGPRVRGVLLVATSAGELAADPRSPGGRMGRLTPRTLSAALAAAGLIEKLRRALPPTSPRHQKLVRGLLYGAEASDAMVLAGAELMHAAPVRAYTAFLPALGQHDKRKELAALTGVPVTILVGESDTLTPVRHSRRLAEALPDAELTVVPRTGHMLPAERPELVLAAIDRLLAAATSPASGDRGAA